MYTNFNKSIDLIKQKCKKPIILINQKFKKPIILTIALFFSGSLLIFIGLSKGDVIASRMSRPIGANSWSTSQQMILGCTYAPAILGIFLMILSAIFSTVLFINWIKEIN